MTRRTNTEIEERVAEKGKEGWKYCEKCRTERWTRQLCKCPACSGSEKRRMFVHINEKNPATVDWNSHDPETDTYQTGVADVWQLCEDCSRKYQVYANWD
tara:strand:+ start:11995 stop:12294 length:300 start_codon:yes stop_codon:yes gene_type:complete